MYLVIIIMFCVYAGLSKFMVDYDTGTLVDIKLTVACHRHLLLHLCVLKL